MAIRIPVFRSFLLIALALALVAASPAGARAAESTHYDLRVSLNFRDASLKVVQKTTFRNNTGVELPDLVFQVVPAYFNSFTLHSARVDGYPVAASRVGTILEIRPSTPLARDATAEVELRFGLKVPPRGGRFGQGQGILALGNWFPILSVYREGWNRYQYADVGDAFFSDIADFDVAVHSDVPVTIAAGGQRVEQGGGVQAFRAEGVRDFPMAISDRYQVRTREVDGVRLAAYGLSAPRLEAYLDAAARTLRWHSAHFTPYPYPTLSIAEMHTKDQTPTAQEYPGLILVYTALGADGGGPGSYSEYTIAHEMAHQWFYSLVGNDQVNDPWLDEAMATYASLLFYRDQLPRSFDNYFGRAMRGYQARVAAGNDRPVNTTVRDYSTDLPYFDIVYRKGAVFLDQLRKLMGDEPFMTLLRDYVHNYSGKMATPIAFLDMAYIRVGPTFPPLVARYFDYGAFAGGRGYQLEVGWPEGLAASGSTTLNYRAGFPVAEARVWLDNRMVYRGEGEAPIRFDLDGVEEGEYILRLDLRDPRGTVYQRATRVRVEPKRPSVPAVERPGSPALSAPRMVQADTLPPWEKLGYLNLWHMLRSEW